MAIGLFPDLGSFMGGQPMADDYGAERRQSSGSDASASQGAHHSNVYLRNIPQDVDDGMLTALFGRFGQIESCR